MKKKIGKLLLTLAALCAAAACAVYLFRNYADRIPFLSRFINDEIEPEEDIFAEFSSDDSEVSGEGSHLSDPQPEHEEKRQTKVRRGYIPLHFHQDSE